jgi:Protein of unknown function (DUF3738)
MTVSPGWAQSTGTGGPEFEVASVRSIVPPSGGVNPCFVALKPLVLTLRLTGSRFRFREASLGALIMSAYNVRRDQLSELPKWASCTDLYEIEATVSEHAAATEEQLRLMLQSLLSDRFGLKIRRETRPFKVYELTAGKNGAKVKLVSERTAESHDPWRIVPLLIEGFLDYPVVDRTGLDGFIPTASEEWDMSELLEEVKMGRPAPSIFHGVEVQFGLSLKRATVSGEYLVIERVEHLTEN